MEDQAETTNSRSVEVPQSVPIEESEISTSPGESASGLTSSPSDSTSDEVATTSTTGISQHVYPTRDRRPPDRFTPDST